MTAIGKMHSTQVPHLVVLLSLRFFITTNLLTKSILLKILNILLNILNILLNVLNILLKALNILLKILSILLYIKYFTKYKTFY